MPAFLSLGIFACSNNASTHGLLTYYYYPQKNVYFDLSSNTYYYSLDGGKRWDSLTVKKDNPAALGPRMILSYPEKNIWRINKEHLEKFNGTVLDIRASDTLFVKDIPRPVKASPVKKTDKKEKKGFFQRLFGKKKKAD